MKQCPSCHSIYTDETLRYCLADGTKLTETDAEEPTVVRPSVDPTEKTVVMPHAAPQRRVDIPVAPAVQPRPSKNGDGSGKLIKVLIVVVVLAVLLIAALGVAAVIYFNLKPGVPAANLSKPTPSPNPASNRPASTPSGDQPSGVRKAMANSPGDGFLALRSLPSSQVGDRILKIPHGAIVTVGDCGPVVTPVNRSGRWCQATYNGYTGWVFDAYLVYSDNESKK